MMRSMPARTGTAHVVTTKRIYKDKVYRTHLLRRSYREDGKVKNETLGNLSHLPDALIDIIRRSLQGETFVAVSQAFEVVRSRAHGHVQAVALAMQRLGLASVIASQPSRERDLVLAMVAARIVQPDTKLGICQHSCPLFQAVFGIFSVVGFSRSCSGLSQTWVTGSQLRVARPLQRSGRSLLAWV